MAVYLRRSCAFLVPDDAYEWEEVMGQHEKILDFAIRNDGKFTVGQLNKKLFINNVSARLSEMCREGLVEVVDKVPATKTTARYFVYGITAKGREKIFGKS